VSLRVNAVVVDSLTKLVEVRIIKLGSWPRSHALHYECTQLRASVLMPDQVAHELATRAVTVLADLFFNELLQSVRKGHIHRCHAFTVRSMARFVIETATHSSGGDTSRAM
jgi:hypothetical protein